MNSNSPLLPGGPLVVAPPPPKRSVLRNLAWLAVLVVIASTLYLYRDSIGFPGRKSATVDAANVPAGRGRRGGGAGPGGTAVVALAARKADMPIYLRGLGSVTPSNTVTVRSRIDGQLVHVGFQEGQFVREGDLLAEIDKRPIEVQLAQAQAQLDLAKANVERDTALVHGATIEFVRNGELLQRGLIPKQEADLQSSTADQYGGSLHADYAAMETAQAAIANANLQLTYSRITAPISGRIGLRLVDSGNMVRAGDAGGLAVIAQLQPITVLFSIPEDNLAPIFSKIQSGQTLKVDAYDREDRNILASGSLLTVDNEIDQTTGTSRLKAIFDNPNNVLFPNQFVNVHLLLQIERNATIIPAAAIQRGPQGTYVYVVTPDHRAQLRPITIRTTEGSDVAVGAELQPGEMVVLEGMDKVQDGDRVVVQAPGAVQTPAGDGAGS